LAEEAPTLAHREAVSRSHYHYARFLVRTGRHREAETQFAAAEEVASKCMTDSPREPRPRAQLANDLIEHAGLFNLLGKFKENEAALRRALAIAEALVADFPSVTEYKELLDAIRRDLAGALNDKRQFDEARKHFASTIKDGEQLIKESPEY